MIFKTPANIRAANRKWQKANREYLARAQKTYYAKRIAAGLCRQCGAARKNSIVHCERCATANCEQVARYQAKKRSALKAGS